MRMLDIIEKKRLGDALSAEELQFVTDGCVQETIPDYQLSALLMAICLNGMRPEETAVLTDCMARSGDLLDLSDLGDTTADKHSTGGVGDKTTLIVAPICAACQVKMAKMSGRGLGHTGGTVDKLESIPGFRVDLPTADFRAQVQNIGLAVISQTADLAPADKKLYALRDASGTVKSIPLIASSIMSKKLAAGAQNIALDVKCGSGAFMKTLEDARALAREMVQIGKACGRNTAALITNMDLPLGTHIGNALEVTEAACLLRGHGDRDLKELCLQLSAHLLAMAHNLPLDRALQQAEQALESGAAYQKLCEMVTAQGGDASVLAQDDCFLPAACSREVLAPQDGYLSRMQTESVGIAAALLGAGRETKDSTLDYAAGIILRHKTGDFVKKGEPIATVFAATDSRCMQGAEKLQASLSWSAAPPAPQPLIFENIQ